MKERILLFSSTHKFQKGIIDQLEEHYEVLLAVEQTEALAKAIIDRPSLIVYMSDNSYPFLLGESLAAHYMTQAVPVIIYDNQKSKLILKGNLSSEFIELLNILGLYFKVPGNKIEQVQYFPKKELKIVV